LKYRGAPPFRKPIQTLTGEGYARPGASETTLRQVSQVLYRLDLTDIDHVRELMSRTGLREGVDWWVVRWSDEGLSDPGTGCEYVLKVRVPAGGSVFISVPALRADHIQSLHVRIYGSANIKVYAYRSIGSVTGFVPPAMPYFEDYLTGDWMDVSMSEQLTFVKNTFFVIKIENIGSSDEFVYIAELTIYRVDIRHYGKIDFGTVRKDLNNSRISIEIRPPIDGVDVLPLIIGVYVYSDGSNPIDVAVSVFRDGAWYQIWSFSSTAQGVWYWLYVPVKKHLIEGNQWYRMRLKLNVSTAGVGYVKIYVQSYYYAPYVRRVPKRVGDRYTSDGDGATDTVTILDYTTQPKHIARLLRVKATGDSNTTQLQLRVDGEVVWDFLEDGDTCELELEDVHKVELLVNDPGGGTTTTVSYVVQYVEEDSIICR